MNPNRVKRGTRIALAGAMLVAASCGCAFAQGHSGDAVACGQLKTLPLDHARVLSARFDPGGDQTYKSDEWTGNLKLSLRLPASCRVKVLLTPTPDSSIGMEIWMPATVGWNGRLWSNGNGGLGGPVNQLDMVVALSRGYATSGNDTGHQGTGLDGKWALGHPQKLIDYGYRADHVTVVNSKGIIKRFYGRAPAYSYFAGGSNGGREALMEAQRYPGDFDGIEAGAPPFDGANTLLYWSWLEQQFQKPGARIPPEKLPAIAAAALKECDSGGDPEVGFVENPRTCHVKPEELLCRGPETDSCLTKAQIGALKAIYDGPGGKDPSGYAFHGYEPGSELNWSHWIASKTAAESLSAYFALQFQRYLVNDNPAWTFGNFILERDANRVFSHMGRFYEALDVNLGRFAARGGKLIIFHGWADPALQPQLSIDYYERVQALMGTSRVRAFLALYMVPGMGHVTGGRGPNTFGQIVAPPPDASPETNIGAALERWVEKGVAPGAIIGREYVNDVGAVYMTEDKAGRPVLSQPICPYPEFARYKGNGDVMDAANFKCVRAGH